MVHEVYRRGSYAAVIAIAAIGSSALAATPATSTDNTSSDENSGTLEEIIVTAQKREQSLQDVPIAVSAFNSDMLETRGVTGVDSLTAVAPGLELPRVYNAQEPFIRGIGTSDTAPGDVSSNAIYVDGVYRPSLPGGLFNFNSVASVEVLKGPQGTLFGRNALGGVINITTKNPDFQPHLDAQVGYGNYNTTEDSLYATAGLTKNIAADLSVYYLNQGEGYVKNQYDGKHVSAGRELSARSKILWHDDDEKTQVILSFDADNYHPNSGIAFGSLGGTPLLDGTVSSNPFTVNEKKDPTAVTYQYGTSATATHDMDWARIVSISSFRHVAPTLSVEQDGTAVDFVDVTQITYEKTYTQEFQLLSPTNSKISWVGGLYFLNDAVYEAPLLLSGPGIPLPFLSIQDQLDSLSYSAFAQTTVPVTKTTNVTAGVRYTRDEQTITGEQVTSPAVFAPSGLVPGSTAAQHATWPKVTYRFAVDQKLTDQVMGYVSASRGFKSGVFNMVTATDRPVKPSTLDAYEIGLKSQWFNNRLRANIAAYYYDYKDIQIDKVITGVSTLINAAASNLKGVDLDLDAALTRHFSMQGSLSYLRGRFTDFPGAPLFSPAVNAVGVRVGGDVLSSIANADGYTTPFTPTVTASLGAQYEIPSPIGTFHLVGSAAYNSGYYWNPDDRLQEPSYTLVDASIKWTSLDGRYDVRFWGNNLADKTYYSYVTDGGVGDVASVAPPRTYGISAGVHL
jgi:iron complex outermembrane receptor protein